MGAVGYAADPLHRVGVLHHGDDGLRGLPEVLVLLHQAQVLAQLGQRLQEELVPSNSKIRNLKFKI